MKTHDTMITGATWVPPHELGRLEHSPLHDACATGDLEAVERLLAARSNPNARTLAGLTPLHIVALIYSRGRRSGQANSLMLARLDGLASALIAAGADARLRCVAGMLPAAIAAGFQPPSLAAETARLALAGAWPTPESEPGARGHGRGTPRRTARWASRSARNPLSSPTSATA
jgi:hypothetical protein